MPTQLVAMGCAVKKDLSDDIQQVINDAEELMYHQKAYGRKSYRAIINTLFYPVCQEYGDQGTCPAYKEYCFAIAKEMMLSLSRLDDLALLAMLHDIGKVGIKSILRNPGRCRRRMGRVKHPEIGWHCPNTRNLHP